MISNFTYVYLLRSTSNPGQTYFGITQNPDRRLNDHNGGKNTSTRRYRPWQLDVAIGFREKHKAVLFEKYLKSHFGRAFASKRF